MAYLSRLILNVRTPEVRRDLSDCQEMHRTVMSAFPEDEERARASFDVLYRTEVDGAGSPRLLVQSSAEPDWSRLPEGYLVRVTGNPGVRCMDRLLERLTTGMQLRFRLYANVSKRVAAAPEPGKRDMRGKRVELRSAEEQESWLRRKGEAGGFQLLAVRADRGVANLQTVPGVQFGSRQGKRMTFGAVYFDGVLSVSDAERFRETVREGIGPGKAYGLGLLSVAPVE